MLLSSFHMGNAMIRQMGIVFEAQKSRGMELETGLLNRLKAYIWVMVPLVCNALLAAEQLAMSAESRAFGSSVTRTHLHKVEMGQIDRVVIAVATVMFVIALVIRIVFGGFPMW
jgi:energy-coupling factor transporter transmembrane protein EcfT